MFCPHCGQEQISEEIRFCPRCGFLLADVAAARAKRRRSRAKFDSIRQNRQKRRLDRHRFDGLERGFYSFKLYFRYAGAELFRAV
jgi:hypothetical protein